MPSIIEEIADLKEIFTLSKEKKLQLNCVSVCNLTSFRFITFLGLCTVKIVFLSNLCKTNR